MKTSEPKVYYSLCSPIPTPLLLAAPAVCVRSRHSPP